MNWDVVMAELAEQSLPSPQVHGSIPVIGEFLLGTFIYCQLYWKDKNKEERAGNCPLKMNKRCMVAVKWSACSPLYSDNSRSNHSFSCKIYVWKERKEAGKKDSKYFAQVEQCGNLVISAYCSVDNRPKARCMPLKAFELIIIALMT